MFSNFLVAVSREAERPFASLSCHKNTYIMSRMAGTPHPQ